jgi:hypothetical protein
MKKEEFESKLKVGTKIRIGKEYAKQYGFKEDEIIQLIEGYFEEDNGLYTYTVECPSILDEKTKDFDSIYHLFGNDFEYFLDCEII